MHLSPDPPDEEYADAVLAELQAHRGGFDGRLVSVHLGGGSPSRWCASAVRRVVEGVQHAFAGSAGQVEVALEANPEEVTAAALDGWLAAGIGRLTLGVQSLDDDVLRSLGRQHDGTGALAAIALAREAGMPGIAVDLIYAVPGQTVGSWGDTLDRVVDSGVGHVSAYNLTLEPGTRFFAQARAGRLVMPADPVQAELYRQAVRTLEGAGLCRYEVSNFAHVGEQSRHNRLYWEGAAYIGLGAGAHSYRPEPGGGRRWRNQRRPADYIEAALGGGGAVAEEESLSAEQVLAERLVMGLRLVEGVTWSHLEDATGLHVAERIGRRVDALEAEGLLARDAIGVRASRRGLEVLDSVVEALI